MFVIDYLKVLRLKILVFRLFFLANAENKALAKLLQVHDGGKFSDNYFNFVILG
jgi:hypothetical protein